MPPVRIGTVDLPERVDRDRYFRELSYLELSALFAAPLKAAALARWTEAAPPRAVGLVAPWVLTQRKPPRAERLWHHDATVGDFRDSAHARSALAAFQQSVVALTSPFALFRSPPLFAPSIAHRDQLRWFFGELATEAAVGAPRVWIPDGLWEPRAAVKFATELGVLCAIDPLVVDPGRPEETYEDLDAPALYFRIQGLGRSGPIRSEKLDELAVLIEHYQDAGLDITVAFASEARWHDARNFKRLLGDTLLAGGASASAPANAPGDDADAPDIDIDASDSPQDELDRTDAPPDDIDIDAPDDGAPG